ncbi:NAD(P)H-dependent oxidoreductase [Mangrovibacillus cuniculi]|uniref:NAD(P)H-dependent oxidoreductase n=1 Tax=Mangrovibacillus cuniculi TaxID=2593652 RepID=A0A7S8HEC8_9BACI|nr:NAD(P)H-dependent oxidoreductase [Mangrovibacillus cuniculi]QPC45593.1 NAD(P)H-dependent oxidoreductase [Mangrovibacillus cuniculi]
MKNILVINGHEYYDFAKGQLNKTLFEDIVSTLSDKFEVKTTIVEEGYDVKKEQEKFQWADVVIFQTPIYWFSLPAAMKKYIDQVYAYGVFFGPAINQYGDGGLMEGKKYMFSTTWNAPETAFNDTNEGSFLQGKDIEDAIAHLHHMQRYVNMVPLKTFGAHDVVANPDIEKYRSELKKHLQDVFMK